jgi:hypothetical protein
MSPLCTQHCWPLMLPLLLVREEGEGATSRSFAHIYPCDAKQHSTSDLKGHLKGYGPNKWHNLTNLECQILISRVMDLSGTRQQVQ